MHSALQRQYQHHISVPPAIRLAHSGPAVLALGGWFKSTACVTRGAEAFVTRQLGDLDQADACAALAAAAEQLCWVLEVVPRAVAHDLHPDFYSTRLAHELAERLGVPAIGVQHHHAHIASVCAEYGVYEPVLGLALDGIGLGADGSAWGGELLRVDVGDAERLGHLRTLKLPGGDAAAREPWRMAASVLHDLGRGSENAQRFSAHPAAQSIENMLERDLNCPPSSSAGRLFDAAAGLLGLCPVQSVEAEAARLLERLAQQQGSVAPLAGGYLVTDGVLDFHPLLAALAECRDAGFGAALFHATLAAGLAQWVAQAAAASGIGIVACGGGCFLNRLLTEQLGEYLRAQGLTVLTPQQLPPGDQAVSLGQAYVAQARLAGG